MRLKQQSEAKINLKVNVIVLKTPCCTVQMNHSYNL